MAAHSLIDGTEVKVPQFVGKRSIYKSETHQMGARFRTPIRVNVFQNRRRDRIKYSGTYYDRQNLDNYGAPKGWACVYRIVVRPKAQIVSEME